MTNVDHADLHLDRDLAAAYALQPSQTAQALMDARLADALLDPPARSMRGWRPRSLVLVFGLVAALVTVAAGGSTLLDRMFRGADPGEQLAWERSTALGLSDTVNGVTVGIGRAYMDGSQIVIGLTSDDYTYSGGATLRVDGRPTPASGGTLSSWPTWKGSAHLMVFKTPSDVGDRASLELVIPRIWRREPGDRRADNAEASPAFSPNNGSSGGSTFAGRTPVEGPWRFRFELKNQGGTGWHGDISDRAAGVTVTLRRVVVSPTLIRAWVSWSGDPLRASEDDVWTAQMVLEHRDDRFGPGDSRTNGNRADVTIQRGTDDPAGSWTVRIERLSSDPGYPPEHITIDGPWVFHIDMPPDGDPSL